MRTPAAPASARLDLGLALALPLSTQLASWIGYGRPEVARARDGDGPVTPAAGAFVIWAPIFASLIGYGALRARRAADLDDVAASRLVRASLIGNLSWSLHAQFRDLGWPSVGLIGLSAVTATAAAARYEHLAEDRDAAGLAANLVAPLAGWLSVATFANVDTAQRVSNALRRSWLSPREIVPVAAAAAAAGVVATRGNPFYAAAAGWALGGIAVKNAAAKRGLAVTAIVGLIAVTALATALRLRR